MIESQGLEFPGEQRLCCVCVVHHHDVHEVVRCPREYVGQVCILHVCEIDRPADGFQSMSVIDILYLFCRMSESRRLDAVLLISQTHSEFGNRGLCEGLRHVTEVAQFVTDSII